jgi:transcriptional regulator with XRE-family HTH domain
MALSRRTRAQQASFDDDTVSLQQEICDEITWYMREHKVSRADLAGAMGVSPGRVSQILSGGENLTLRTLGSVVSALGAKLEFTLAPLP